MTTVDVLAFAAHPDDAEVGCGGTLARCVQSGASVAIVDLTAAEMSTTGDLETRRAEARAAADALGVAQRISLGLPDGGVGVDPAHRDELVRAIRQLRPRIVLAPYHLSDRHPDHAAAGRLARDASFLAGVRRIGTGEPHRPERVYHYLLHQLVVPDFVVDVSDAWDARTRAVQAYASQFGESARGSTAIGGADFQRVLTARAETFGAMIGARYGEGFCSEGPVGVSGLPGLDRPPRGLTHYGAFL
jgi:N-acetylglucosamine malate deacetylase 1